MANKDIRVSIGFLDHPKTFKLKKLLGPSGVESLLRLWFFAAQSKTDGLFFEMKPSDIEIAAKWKGRHGRFVNALLEVKFLDVKNGIYSLHDWAEHNGYVIHSKQREDRARRAAEARWHTISNACSIQQVDAPSIIEQCPLPAPSPAPSPKERLLSKAIPDSEPEPFDPPEPQKNPFSEKDNDKEQKRAQFEKQFRVLQNRILGKWPRFNLQVFFQMNLSKNRDAILHSLNQTVNACTSTNPERYAQTILDKESGNFNERISIKEAEENKKLYAGIIEAMKEMGGIKS